MQDVNHPHETATTEVQLLYGPFKGKNIITFENHLM